MAAIVAADIKWHYTTTAGAAGNSTANTTVSTFLGKYASSSLWAGGSANDLFADITGAENAASQVDYAGLFIENSNASNDYQSPAVWISAETAGGASIAIGVDTTSQSLVSSASAQLVTIASRTTAPAGASFSSPTTFGTGVALGTLTKGGYGRGLWVRRTAANTAALSGDGMTLSIQGDTGSL